MQYDKHIENGPGYSTVKVLLKDVTPDASIQHHVVFDRSIFKDCDVTSDAQGTTITVNTVPVSSFRGGAADRTAAPAGDVHAARQRLELDSHLREQHRLKPVPRTKSFEQIG